MNRLADRLQLIADQINKGETMADIGTDHGFLPLYLFEEGISPKTIMCDISEPSLAKAREAFDERFGAESTAHAESGFDFRVGDGLNVLKPGEVDTVVIAGMGGLLIKDILEADKEKSISFKKFILQPRNNSGALRYWLISIGFRISHNLLVREGKFICEIIVARPDEHSDVVVVEMPDYDPKPDDPAFDFPHEFLERYPALGREYALRKLETEEKIKDGILKSCNVSESDLKTVENRIDYFRRLLGK